MINYDNLTPEENAELKQLNENVDLALEARKEWLDKKMSEKAHVKVGEDLYDLNTGVKLGVVTKHYRYYAEQNPLYDTSLSVDYQYQEQPRFWPKDKEYPKIIKNTSSEPQLIVGSRERAIEWAKRNYERIQSTCG